MKLPVSSYFYKGGDEDLGDGNSVLLKVRHDGPGMAIKTANATSTIGTVAADQTAYSKDYDVDVRTLLEIIVPAHEVFGHEYIEFYTMSTNNYRSTAICTYRRKWTACWITSA